MKKTAIRVLFGAVTAVSAIFLSPSAHAQTLVYNNIWNINPGTRPYVKASGTTERAIAVNPVNSHVYVASRSTDVGGLGIFVLDGATGNEILDGLGQPLQLNTNNVSGGSLNLNSINVADDGVIYACNNSGASFKIYRWADETSAPTVAFGPLSPGPGTRYGDTMDVRGSGVNTEIVVSGSGNAGFAIFKTTDGVNFTSTGFAMPASTSAGDVGKGITFGNGNTIYGKKDGVATVRHISYDTATTTATLIENVSVDLEMGPINFDPERNLLCGVLVGNANQVGAHRFKIYDISNAASPVLAANYAFPTASVSDSLVGGSDCKTNLFVGVDPNNGIVAAKAEITFAPIPPTITLQPTNQTVLSGGFFTLSSDADGTLPIGYKWYFNGVAITNTNSFSKNLLIKPAYTNNAGSYFMVASNAGGMATSSVAVVTVTPSDSTAFAEEVWSLGAGSRAYLTSTTRQRGIAYNPANDHLLVQSGSASGGPAEIYVLNAATGADIRQMNMTGVTGGFFPLNVIAVAEDGVVYGANLALESGGSLGQFKLYRWANDAAATVPTVAYGPADPWGAQPDPRSRFGDTINIRGSGTNTQIILTANKEPRAVIFTTTDGTNFTPNPITVTNIAELDQFRLGVAFGSGNTFWTKGLRDDANGRETAPLRNIAFNLATGTGASVHSYAAALDEMSAIGVEVQNDILAGLNFGTPDSIKVFDISDLSAEPPIMDQDFYATDNANQFFTGAFDSGGGRLYSLNTGNGLLCLRINTTLPGITKQPVSLTNAAGTRAEFSVKSTGYPRSSRWQFNGVDLPGANTSTLAIQDVRGTNAGTYKLIITNTLGSVTSSIVSLRVTASILLQPVSTVANIGDNVTLTGAADGEAPTTLQWRRNGVNIPGATNSVLNFSNIQPSDGGDFSFVVTSPLNTVTSQVAVINVLQPSTPGTGTGLLAEYYSDDLSHTLSGSPTVTQNDPWVNYDWGAGAPIGGISDENFSVRWSGQVEPLYSQEYTFYVDSDDGARLWVNGQQIINRWANGSGVASGKITLNANQKYNIILEYFEATGSARANLQWSSVSQLKDIVPTSQLYPTLGTQPVAITATRATGGVVLNWTGSFSLQSSTNVVGPYSTIVGATSPYTNSFTGSQRYFRLIGN